MFRHHHFKSMTRTLNSGIALCLALAIILALPQPAPAAAAAATTTPAAAATTETVYVGLIPNEGGIDDHNFNEMAAAGLVRAVADFDVIQTVYPTTGPGDYATQIASCVAAGNDLCITVGFSMSDATLAAAEANPAVKFAIVDMSWENYPANLRGMVFAADEVGYLAGTLAGLMTESRTIGAIGGMPIPAVDAFLIPYEYGAQWVNPAVIVRRDYANDFSDPDLGALLAQAQLAQGADVIFGVGGMMGNGAILAAAEAGAWAIGVDVDTYYSAFGGGTEPGAENLLSSALKRVDNAVYNTIKDVVNGTFTSGEMINNLANEGVGLASYHEAAVPQEVQDAVQAAAQGILNGEIDVWAPPAWQRIYLPLTLK